MKQVGIIVKKNHPDALELGKDLCRWLKVRGCTPLAEEELAEYADDLDAVPLDILGSQAELLVVLGGDGTLLGAARLVTQRSVPILGVNLGNLGFLTEIARDQLFPVLEQVLAGDFQISERMMLDAEVYRQGKNVGTFTVLNDIVINKGALARIIDIDAEVGDSYLSNFRADGFIVATPTGTTGYNLAAGGPIITPGQNCFALCPICPFSLTNRPIVISDRSTVRMTVRFQDEDVFLTADGQMGMPLRPDDRVDVARSVYTTRLIANPEKDYFNILRTKLGWGSANQPGR